MPKKAEPEETEVEGEEITIDTENVDYGKSCSIVWVFYLRKILEYCQPKQLVQNTTVCKKWKGLVIRLTLYFLLLFSPASPVLFTANA